MFAKGSRAPMLTGPTRMVLSAYVTLALLAVVVIVVSWK